MYYQSDFQHLKTLSNELRDQRNKRKLDFLLTVPVFSQLKRSVTKWDFPGATHIFTIFAIILVTVLDIR